jgi:hypothetical protein
MPTPSPLEREPESRARGPGPETEDEKGRSSESGAREPELDGKELALDRVLEEEGDAEEQDYHAHGHDEARTREIRFRPCPGAIEHARFELDRWRGWRRRWGRSGRRSRRRGPRLRWRFPRGLGEALLFGRGRGFREIRSRALEVSNARALLENAREKVAEESSLERSGKAPEREPDHGADERGQGRHARALLGGLDLIHGNSRIAPGTAGFVPPRYPGNPLRASGFHAGLPSREQGACPFCTGGGHSVLQSGPARPTPHKFRGRTL